MKKISLIVLSIIIVVMGILALFPGITIGTEPLWHAIIKIVFGLAGLFIGLKKD